MGNFIVHGLPRSRTKWLSKFLTYKDYTCTHEMAMTFREVDDFRNHFKENIGSCETGVAQGWWMIQRVLPGIKTVVVKRPVEEVLQSLKALDLGPYSFFDWGRLEHLMHYGDKMLDQISNHPGVLTVQFKDLKRMETCASVFEHCLPYKFDIKHWSQLKNQNLQINFRELIRYRHAHKPEIDRFKRLCKQELIKIRRTEPDNPLWKKAGN